MLNDTEAVATIAVSDIEVAKKFYEDKLQLKPKSSPQPGVLMYKSGNDMLLVYESQFAGTNKATAATWAVADVEREVSDLKSRGVSFEHYEIPGMIRNGDVHGDGNSKAAWFKDPDGNILAVVSR